MTESVGSLSWPNGQACESVCRHRDRTDLLTEGQDAHTESKEVPAIFGLEEWMYLL